MEKKPKHCSFIVKVTYQDNATWQGIVTWLETNQTQPFRSALELIKMIDGALDKR